MVTVLIIAAAILLYTMQSLFTRMYTDNYPGEQQLTTPVFAVVCGLIVAVVSFIFSGFSFSCGWLTVLLGVINAVVLYAYDTVIIKGSATGPYSILMTFNLSGGIILPAVAAWIFPGFFGEAFSWVQLFAILTVLSSVLMISIKPDNGENKEEMKKTRGVFLLICTFLGLANGAYGIMLNAQQLATGVSEKEEMVTITFLGTAVICFVQLLIQKKKQVFTAFRQTKKSLIFMLLTATVSALAINVLVIALEYADSTLVYTFDNAGVLLLSVLCSAVLFKEKLSKLNIAGCAVMAAGLVAMAQYANIENWLSGLFA